VNSFVVNLTVKLMN